MIGKSTTPCPHCGGTKYLGNLTCGLSDCIAAEKARADRRFDARHRPKFTRAYEPSIYLDTIHIKSAANAALYIALCDAKLSGFPAARELEPKIGELEEAARAAAASWGASEVPGGSFAAIDRWRRVVAHGVGLAKDAESRRLRATAEAKRRTG